ncbi:MAG: InlB B-repeat-containing protein [Treponema sp.]|jgi:uncharacterized repeat protein (TIGR02543 family)|nr:InlB B-repeat-containing protein [Treponema sp.]
MKKNRFLFGLPAILLALGLVFSACDVLGEKENEPNDPIQYTVTYSVNGGSGTAPSSQTVNSGTAITLADGSGLTNSGYTFSGWNTSADGAGTTYASGASFTVTSPITLYAKWIAASGTQYTVTYNANGGSGTAPSSQTVNSGTAIALADKSGLTKAGYTFSGWNTSASGTGTLYAVGASFTVTSPITLYATWIVASGIQYTVTYDVNGGSGTAPPAQTVDSGTAIALADKSGLTNSGYTFSGWNTSADGAGTTYASGASFLVTSPITLYAKWSLPAAAVPGSTLQDALEWLDSNAEQGGVYTITLSADETIAPRALSYSRQTVSISIDGGTTERTISLSQNGSLFTVGSSVTLTLGNNVTLQGQYNTASLVQVNSGGTLAMENGSKLTGNTAVTSYSYLYGGGVSVRDGGMFTMNGGEITGNTSYSYSYPSGGGVSVRDGGTFTMNGGEITGNTASVDSYSNSYGGGVYVSGGTFTMNGGEISGNTASADSYSVGGGVYVYNGTFTMSGGEISDNTASFGGGVSVRDVNSTFTMSGGEISGNSGDGVDVDVNSTFTMSGGEISGNSRGVYVDVNSRFTMSGGEISGNSGSGVYVYNNSTFTMNNGEISGNSGSGVQVSSRFTMSGGEISGNSRGVYVSSSGTFTMNDGEISGNGNTASADSYSVGGGVYVYNGTFTMSGGEISGNTASADSYSYGGGVYVSGGTFTKQSGGIIYGSDAESGLRNTATGSTESSGQAVYVASSPVKKRDSTAGVGVTLDSAASGSAGGWE